MAVRVGVALVAVVLAAAAEGQEASPLPPCGGQQVTYGPPGEAYRSRVRIERVAAAPGAQSAPAGAVVSPQGTRWFVLAEPDFLAPGPWRTVLTVTARATEAPGWRLTVGDHASYGVRAHWLNEKLLFVEAWWGRVAATDLVLDVESGAPLYAEDADLVALIQPCDEGSPSPR